MFIVVITGYFIQEVVLKASSTVVQNQWYHKLRELVEALRPACEPQGSDDHVIPGQQATATAAVHTTVSRLNSREDERSSPLAKMTRIFEGQRDDPDSRVFTKGLKRKTL